MNEEQVTKALIGWLSEKGWRIVSYDFPQSGTGLMLHPDAADSEKNKDSIVPDIIAVKNNTCLFFENKSRFVLSDFHKINNLKTGAMYGNAIANLLPKFSGSFFFGIGFPSMAHKAASRNASVLVDFIMGVDEDLSVQLLHMVPNLSQIAPTLF